MKSNNKIDMNNQDQKLLLKKKVKIIKLSQKSKEPSFFSQSLYLTKFLHKNRTKNMPDTTKFVNRSSLIMSKQNKIIKIMKKKLRNSKTLKILDMNRVNIHNSLNSLQSLKHSRHNTNTNTYKNKKDNAEHNILYEDNLKLKAKINKLRIELFFIKSLNKRKDEEIEELNKYLEEAKYSLGKTDKNYYLKKIKNENIIIQLKDTYKNIKLKLREKINTNNALINKMKGAEINDMKKKNEEETNKLKEKIEELKEKYSINQEMQKVLEKSSWKRKKFLENYDYLIQLKDVINKKYLKVEALTEKAFRLKDKKDEIKMIKRQLVRYNRSIKHKNEELMIDKKYRQDFIMKRAEIEQKILSYTIKSQNLNNKCRNDEFSIQSFLNEQNNNSYAKGDFYEYMPQLEPNPEENKGKQVLLYESLIKESKKRQKRLVKLLNDFIGNTTNNFTKNENENENGNKNENQIGNENENQNENSKIFNNNNNFDLNDINIEYNSEKLQRIDLQFLLNIMFYIKNIQKEKIQNILLNFKTENYYIGELDEGDSFISELSSDILGTINNRKDVNNIKEILVSLFETKYNSNKILFLNKIINDIFIVDNKNKILFIKDEVNILFYKLRNILSNKINSIIKKIKNLQVKKILYEKLKTIFIEENIYNKNDSEKIKLFQFFVYILKRKEIDSKQNNSLDEFSTKDIIDILYEFEEEIIYRDNFMKALKNLLEENNKNFNELTRNKKALDISEFIDILNENKFEINDDSFDLKKFLEKYKTSENSDDINIELLKNDFDKISVI